jgi:hypothetical protein
VKNFSERPARTPEGEKFSVKRGVDFIRKRTVYGSPDPDKATTYAIERSNLNARQWNARLRRRTLSFSKDLGHHKAAVALHYVQANMCHIPRNMRITPAMAAGVTDHMWTLGEFMDAVLGEPSAEKPQPKPLVIPRPDGIAKELPGGRGWLRVVPGGDGQTAPPPVEPTPPPVAVAMPSAAPSGTDPQLDLFAWKPRPAKPLPPRGTQLNLFGDLEGGEPLS